MGNIIIPLGPQHPALEEPESFRLHLEGERIKAASVALGYNHRGMEKACESKTYIQNIYLLERVCGICSHSHSTCYVRAVEAIAGIEVPKRAQYLRTLIGELERIHSHLLWLGIAGHEIGFTTLFMYAWKDREIVLDILEMLTGNRVNYGMNMLGGVRRNIDADQAEAVLKALDTLEERTKYYTDIVLQEESIIHRISGVGKLSKEDAIRFGTVGPILRATGVPRDLRKDDPYGIYEELEFSVITDEQADVMGGTIVRVLELMESFKLCRQVIRQMPYGPIAEKVPLRVPPGETFSRYEAPRGENVHYVRSNGTDKPDRVKVRGPSLANLAAITNMMVGGYLADVPVIIAAIDPCFSCTDRMVRIQKETTGEEGLMNWEDLRNYGITWYRKHGLDFQNLHPLRKEG